MDSDVTSTVTAETAVQLYFLNITDLEMAFDVYPEVKLRLWKNCAIKIVSNLLSEHKEFQVSSALGLRRLLCGVVPPCCQHHHKVPQLHTTKV